MQVFPQGERKSLTDTVMSLTDIPNKQKLCCISNKTLFSRICCCCLYKQKTEKHYIIIPAGFGQTKTNKGFGLCCFVFVCVFFVCFFFYLYLIPLQLKSGNLIILLFCCMSGLCQIGVRLHCLMFEADKW